MVSRTPTLDINIKSECTAALVSLHDTQTERPFMMSPAAGMGCTQMHCTATHESPEVKARSQARVRQAQAAQQASEHNVHGLRSPAGAP